MFLIRIRRRRFSVVFQVSFHAPIKDVRYLSSRIKKEQQQHEEDNDDKGRLDICCSFFFFFRVMIQHCAIHMTKLRNENDDVMIRPPLGYSIISSPFSWDNRDDLPNLDLYYR